MILMLVTTGLLLVAAIAIGQAVLRGLGVRSWTWLAPSVGLAVMMVVVSIARVVPGRALTTAVLLAIVLGAALWIVVRDRMLWPDPMGLLAALPVIGLALTPFLVAGWPGILGVSFNNDMGNHLSQVAGLMPGGSDALLSWDALGYPLGPHSLVASISAGLDIPEALAFSGFSIALPVILGWTGLHALRHPVRWAPFPMMILVGFPFMVAAYYAEGAFKENMMAIFVMAIMLLLARRLALPRPAKWLPFALIIAGAVTAYSYPGLTWPILFLVGWAIIRMWMAIRTTGSVQVVWRAAKANLVPLLIAAGAVVVLLVPQARRIYRFASWDGISVDNIGNLVGPLPFWETFGVWNTSDFRIVGVRSEWVGLGAIMIGAVVVAGAVWALRRRYWMEVLAPVLAIAVWVWSDQTQSAYVAAKTLTILAPLLMLLAMRPIVERDPMRPAGDRMLWIGRSWRPLAAIALIAIEMVSTVRILGAAPVGPLDQTQEIQNITHTIGDRKTLYLGNDDFTPWLFRGTPVQSPVIGFPAMPFREGKPFQYGFAYDIDSIDPSVLESFDFIVTPRDAAASRMPAGFVLVRQSASFDVYERTGRVEARAILPGETSPEAGARLDCGSALGRSILLAGGVAALRPAEVSSKGATFPARDSATVELTLDPGTWDLVVNFVSARPIKVTGGGLSITLPAYLGRPGPRWPAGQVTVHRAGRFPIRFQPVTNWLSPTADSLGTALVYVISVTAVAAREEEIVPIREACGKVIDWYRSTRP